MENPAIDEPLRARLLEMRDRDQAIRRELVERGELFEGYHSEMEQVHREHAAAFEAVLDEHGWPGVGRVGDDGSQAAFLVAAHAISLPAFQRRCVALLGRAVDRGEAAPAYLASLMDRVCFHERVPQRYGTILDWDEHGVLSPWTIDDPDGVDARREAVGLPPIGQSVQRAREHAALEGERPSGSYAERQAEMREWAIRVGWIER